MRAIWAIAAILSSMTAAALPSAKIGRAPLIAPSAAESFYGTGTTSTNSTGAATPNEIAELARALDNNVDEIYDFVRNYVDTVFIFGAQKGSLGAIVDKSGTPFDQAKLMVDLLRQAGYTASYQVGTITLTGAQFAAWTNVTNLQAACDLLASGAIPASLNGSNASLACTSLSSTGTVSTATIEHIWVSVSINGTTYVFDPSYKTYNFTTGVNLQAAASLSTGQAITAATSSGYSTGTTSGVTYVAALNATSLNTQLTTYASNLQNYIQNQNSVAGVPLASGKPMDLVGGREISRYTAPVGGLRQTTLPYSSTLTRTWSGNIPDQFRSSLTISLTKFLPTGTYATVLNNVSLFADDIYGRKLIFNSNFSPTTFTGALEVVDEFGNATTIGTQYTDSSNPGYSTGTITIAVNHPYAADAAGTLSTLGTYMDTVITRNLRFSTPFTIVHGWGEANRGLVDKWATRLDTALPLSCPPASETCGDSPLSSAGDGRREQLAASWLVQSSIAARLHAYIGNSLYTHHHTVGIVTGDSEIKTTNTNTPGGTPNYIYSVMENFDRIDADTGFSVTSLNEVATDRRVVIHSIAATLEALEGSQSAQISDLPDTTSTATRFEWGNSPPAADDPSGVPSGSVGARLFLDFNSSNAASESTVQSLMLTEGQVTTTVNPVTSGQQVAIDAGEMAARQGAVATLINSYATAGFRVIASQETFLGPGQRAGAFDCNVSTSGDGSQVTLCTHRYSKQRGGAFVATRFDATTGDPLEIAHISANYDYDSETGYGIKGGGGGAQPSHQAMYDPSTAADVLKSKFVDRSKVLGVDMQKGGLTYESPASLTVGSGEFPYSLTANMTWRGGLLQDDRFGPISHVAPNAPWTTNWNNILAISGSALELMDKNADIRATAGTVAAFLAMQDIYRSPVSAQREVAAVLAGSWWVHQLTGNVATVSVGTDTKQFIQKYDGTWFLPGAGSFASLTQTGQRAVYTQPGCGSAQNTYVLSRGWDYSGVSFAVTNTHGDTQNFGFWGVDYHDGTYCAFQHGFELKNWIFPFGVTVSLTYTDTTGALPVLQQVSNSLGWSITFVNSGLGGFTDGTRSVSITDPGATVGGTTVSAVHTDPTNSVTTLNYEVLGGRYLLNKVFTPDSASLANVAYAYDTLERVETAQDAVALWYPGTRNPYAFYIAEDARADRVDPAGGDYTIYYDTYRRPLAYEDEIQRTTSVTHDGRGRVASYTYPEGNKELFAYDDHNNTTNYTKVPVAGSPLSNTVVTAQWNQTWNKPSYIKDALLNETDFVYYPSGNGESMLETATRPSPDGVQARPVYSFTYNTYGRPLLITDPTNLVTSNSYDASTGNLLSTTVDPSGIASLTSFGYDAFGNVTSVTDPRTYVTESQYDLDRRKTYVLHHNGSISAAVIAAEKVIYDSVGRQQEQDAGVAFSGTSITTWLMVKQYSYFPTGKVHTETDGAGDQTTYTYDPMDRTQIVTDPAGRRIATVYDLAGETLDIWRGWNSTTAPTASTVWNPTSYSGSGPVRYAAYTYYSNGEVATTTDANNNLTTSLYDGFDRLYKLEFPSPTLGSLSSNTADFEAYTYDANNNRKSVQTRDGQLIQYTYDNLNRQTLKDLPGTTTGDVYSGYDLAGRPSYDYFGSATGQGVSYGYDTAKRLTSETQFGRTMAFQYDPANNQIQTTWPDGNYINHDFDAMNREYQIRENGATSGAGLLAMINYDSLSRRHMITRGNGTTTTLGYDAALRIDFMSHDLVGTAQDLTVTYQYTLASQLYIRAGSNSLYDWLPAAGSTTYTPDGLNRYAAVAGSTFAYDGRGNMISDGVNSYNYDVENRLLSASSPTAISLAYDPLGRLQQTVVGASTTQFLYSGTQLVAEYDGSGNVLRRYVHGPGVDDPVVWYEGSTLATRNYLHADERGSIIATTDNSGAGTVYTYGQYGEPEVWTGSRFRYTGQTAIPEAQLYYYKARVYSPMLGRFLQTDPIGSKDDLDLYTYAKGDSINGTDSTGLCDDKVGAASSNCKVYGKAQETTSKGKSTGHAAASEAVAQRMTDSGLYERVHMNQAQSTVTGDPSAGNQRADVAGVGHDGKVDTVEITSTSQTNAGQDVKGAGMQARMQPETQGNHTSMTVEEALSGKVTFKGAGGTALGIIGPLISLPGALMDLHNNPNMSTIEFLYRAAGQLDIGIAIGAVPDPNANRT